MNEVYATFFKSAPPARATVEVAFTARRENRDFGDRRASVSVRRAGWTLIARSGSPTLDAPVPPSLDLGVDLFVEVGHCARAHPRPPQSFGDVTTRGVDLLALPKGTA
jgi:hypothetical protein